MFIDTECEIWIMSKEDTRESHVGWNKDNWQVITANLNRSDRTKVTKSGPVINYDIILSISIFVTQSRTDLVIISHTWEKNLETVKQTCMIAVARCPSLQLTDQNR